MDLGSLQDYFTPKIYRVVWTVIAFSASCLLSLVATCFCCYILRVVHNSPDVDELGITLDTIERTGSQQSAQIVHSRMINN